MAVRVIPEADNSFTGTGAAAWNAMREKVFETVSVFDKIPSELHAGISDGTNTTDLSIYILAAVNVAAGQSNGATASVGAVYFPPGIYKVGTSACLTPTVATTLPGIHFFGAGMYTSVLRLSTSGSDLYFYNNVATARAQGCTFSDLGFEGRSPTGFSAYTDISDNAKGFRLWATTATGSQEQNFQFTRCRLQYLHTVLETAGDNTASENIFVQCVIRHVKGVVLKTSNVQSFNHEFHGCKVEVIYGDVLQVSTNGGGAIKFYGGSVIMLSDTAADTYFLRVTDSTGFGGEPFSFNGIRFELRGDTTKLVNVAQDETVTARFNDCLLEDQGTTAKTNWVKVGNLSCVYFDKCNLYEVTNDVMRFTVNQTVSSQYGINGEIIFDKCQLPADFSDKCNLANDTFGSGLISARNCYGSNVGAPSNGAHFANDFDLRGSETAGQVGTWSPGATQTDSGSPAHPQWVLKTAQIKLQSEYWPDTTEHTLKLPKNALIKNIHLRKPAHAWDATSTTLRVGRNDKSGTDHLSVTANFNAVHSSDVTNYFFHVGTTTNERTLRLYTNENPTGVVQGGLCIVEYY